MHSAIHVHRRTSKAYYMGHMAGLRILYVNKHTKLPISPTPIAHIFSGINTYVAELIIKPYLSHHHKWTKPFRQNGRNSTLPRAHTFE